MDSLPAEPQGKSKNTGEASLSLLRWILPTQESNWDLLHCRRILYHCTTWEALYIYVGKGRQFIYVYAHVGFSDSSVGKESACNAGDHSSIPRSGWTAGEGIDYPIQYSWTSLVAQLVKNPPAMWETWVLSLGWEDCPREGKGYPLQYSGLENSMDCIVHEVVKSQTWLSDFNFDPSIHPIFFQCLLCVRNFSGCWMH